MGSVRIEKVQELIKQEASEIIMRELKDPRIGFVTIQKLMYLVIYTMLNYM